MHALAVLERKEREKSKKNREKFRFSFSHRQLNALSLHQHRHVRGEISLIQKDRDMEKFSYSQLCLCISMDRYHRESEKTFSLNFFSASCGIFLWFYSIWTFLLACSIVDKIEANLMNYWACEFCNDHQYFFCYRKRQ